LAGKLERFVVAVFAIVIRYDADQDVGRLLVGWIGLKRGEGCLLQAGHQAFEPLSE
jgi:hypothetical protein